MKIRLLCLLMLIVPFAACEKPAETKGTKDSTANMAKSRSTESNASESSSSAENKSVADKVKTEAANPAMENALKEVRAIVDSFGNRRPPSATALETAKKTIQDYRDQFPGTDVEAYALTFEVMTVGPGPGSQESMNKLFDDHIKSEAIGKVIPMLGMLPSAENSSRIDEVIEKNEVESVRGLAMFTKTQLDSRAVLFKDLLKDEEIRKQIEASPQFGKEAISYIENYVSMDEDALISTWENLSEQYGDIETMPGKTISEVAESTLFEIKFLSVGKTAPDIVDEDIAGEEFKLSDYRGKVVMLDFWGDW